MNGIQEVEGSIPFVSTKKMPTLDTIGRNADGIGLFGGGGPPQISQLKQKIQTGGSQKLAGSEPQNSIEIHSVLFEMRFFKKGAVFIFRKRALKLQRKENHCYAGDKCQLLLEDIRRQIERNVPNPRERMRQSDQNEINMSL